MTMRDVRRRRSTLPVLLLLPLLGAPVFAMTLDDDGSPYTSTGEIQAAQRILQGDHYLRAGRYEPGRMDQGTIDAVRAFQRRHTIPDSGMLDRETVAQLVAHGSSLATGSATGAASGVRTIRGEESSTAAPAGRSMPATAGPVPWMTALGAALLGGGLLLARRRRA